MRILGLILVLGVIIMGTMNGGKVRFFIDTSTVVMLAGFTVGALLFAGVRIPLLFRSVFSNNLSLGEIEEAARGWGQTATYVQAAGWVSFLVGLGVVGNTLDSLKYIGPLVSLQSLSILYAIVVAYAICHPVRMRLEGRLTSK